MKSNFRQYGQMIDEKTEPGKVREEKRREERRSQKRKSQKKEDADEKVEKSLGAQESRKVGSQKRRVQSQLGR